MNVVVATDGALDASKTAQYVVPLAGGDTIHVLTVVEVPRRLLSDLRAVYGEQPAAIVDPDAERFQVPVGERPPSSWPGDDAMIERYLQDKLVERTGPVVEAITAAGGTATAAVLESESTASTILEHASKIGAQVICIGARGQGLFEGLLGSVGTKITRRSEIPVLLMH